MTRRTVRNLGLGVEVLATGPALPAGWAVAGLLAVAGAITATLVIVLRLGPSDEAV